MARPRELTSLRSQKVVSIGTRTAPTPAPRTPEEPDWDDYFGASDLATSAKLAWKWLIRQLRDANVPVGELDGWILAEAVACKVRIEWLERQLCSPEHDTNRGPAKSALFSPLNQYRTHLRWYMQQLGLDPTSRQRIAVPEADEDDDSDLLN